MTKHTYIELNRVARLGNLGTLCFSAGSLYDWFLANVYDLRFPHCGADHHALNGAKGGFDSYRNGNFLWALKWKRQQRQAANIKFCTSCKSHHHFAESCLR